MNLVWDNSNFSINNFHEHQFFADTGNGFVLVGSVLDSNTNTYLIPNYIKSNYNPQFFIKTFYGPSSSLINYTDTIFSISFDLISQFDGSVQLSWNHPILYDSIPSSSSYVIEKSNYVNPPGSAVWVTVANLAKDSTSYIDHTGGCTIFLNYRVRLSTGNCDFISNMDGDLIIDQKAPDPPLINSVSIDTVNNYLTVNWSPSFAQDVSAYIIFKFSSGVWNPVDTVYGYLNNTYIDTTITTFQDNIVQYAIAAMDSCSSGSPPQNNTSSAGSEHQNILLNKQYDQCSGEVKLTWNPYINFSNGLKYYEVYFRNNLNQWTLLDTITSNTFSYFVQQGNLDYSFIVKAVANSNYFSLSNQLVFFASQPPIPQISYIESVNVFSDSIIITYLGENNIGINEVNFYRSTDDGLSFQNIYSESNPTFPFVFSDLNASPAKKSYLYQVSVIDSCNNEVAFSNIGSSIFLDKEKSDFLTNEISWTSYHQWQKGVLNYEVMILDNTLSIYQLLATVDSSVISHIHSFESLVQNPFDGRLCYKVIANEITNDLGVTNSSISNELCIQHSPLVFIPNALRLNGRNNRWSPVVNMIDFSDFQVLIYNRYGELIYELSDQSQSWDGTMLNSSNQVPIGVYVFLMQFKNPSGQLFSKKGHITVVD